MTTKKSLVSVILSRENYVTGRLCVGTVLPLLFMPLALVNLLNQSRQIGLYHVILAAAVVSMVMFFLKEFRAARNMILKAMEFEGLLRKHIVEDERALVFFPSPSEKQISFGTFGDLEELKQILEAQEKEEEQEGGR